MGIETLRIVAYPTELTESLDDALSQRIMHNPYHDVAYYTCSLNDANLYITSDQDITIGS